MTPRLYLITGSTVAGKTTLVEQLIADHGGKTVPKFTTRSPRTIGRDDSTYVPRSAFKDSSYTFTYAMNGELYGITAEDVVRTLQTGNAFVVVSDPRVVYAIKSFFGSAAVSLYVYRNLSAEQLRKALQSRGEHERENPDIRQNRLYLMQRQYVDNIALFDHVILNTRHGHPEDMVRQTTKLIRAYDRQSIRRGVKGPVIFLVAAASGAGKGTLSKMMFDLGGRAIQVVVKATDREVDPAVDGDEIVHDDLSLPKYDITYDFYGTGYGIATEQMWTNLQAGRSQILVTNRAQFPRFIELFGDLVVPIYLHSTKTRNQRLREQIAKHGSIKGRARVRNMDAMHRDYIAHISDYRHVLLNTLAPEDLADQMLRLIEHYREGAGLMIGTRSAI